MAAVAQLKAILGLDNKQYKAGVRDSTGATKKFSRELAGIGRMMATAFSVGAIIAATKRVVDFASEIRHTADNLNVTTEGLQALNVSALKYGMNVADMVKLLGKLRQSQGKAAEGDKEYTDSLKLLNIEEKKFARANTDKALEMIARAYVKSGESALAFSAVQDLVGRSGKKATAFLVELAEKGMGGLIDEADKAGTMINEKLITQLELLGTKNEQLMLKMKIGWGRTLGAIGGTATALGAQLGTLIGQAQTGAGAIKKRGIGEFFKGGLAGIWERMRRAREVQVEAGAAAVTGPDKPLPPRNRPGPQAAAENVTTLTPDIKAWQKANKEAGDDLKKRVQADQKYRDSVSSLMDTFVNRATDITENTRGRAGTDSMASVGIFAGPQRQGMMIADRQFKIQVDLRRLAQEQLEELRTLTAERGGQGE